MTTGKTIVLTRWTFVVKVISLLFNMVSRLVMAFFLRSKCFFVFLFFKFNIVSCVYIMTISKKYFHEISSQKCQVFSWCQFY